MDFDFSDDQEQLRDAIARWVSGSYGFERRQKIVAAGGFDRAVWDELAGIGLPGLYIVGEYGGLDMSPIDGMIVMEELGRGLVMEPVAPVLVASAILQAYGEEPVRQRWLPQVASGRTILVLAHQERGMRYRLDTCTTTASKSGDGYTVSGIKNIVPAGDRANAWLVPAQLDDKLALFVVQHGSDGVATRSYITQDEARAGDLELTQAPAELVSTDGLRALAHAADTGIALACAEGVGIMEQMLQMTVAYMNQRKQFGVPIASFQALRHRVAHMKMQLELARSMSYYVTLKLGDPAPERRMAAARAKVQLGRSMRTVGQESVQLHGGIGMTDEYAGSHYFKRLTQLEMTWGDTLHHQAYVSEHMQDEAGVFA